MATQTLVLQGESELRLEVDFDKIVVVTVKEGIAEVLGLELAQGKEYAFAGAKVAIYTWFGARVEVVGETTSCYATGRGETTQHATLNAHSYLETRRDEAARKVSEAIAGASYKACDAGLSIAKGDKAPPTGDASALSGVCADYQKACAPTKDCRGPRVLVCGPTDSGKSTLCATLCAYAARLGREPLFVDLDPGLGDCGAPPGAIAACRVVREHATVQEGCVGGVDDAPLAFWLGRTEPQDHGELYDHVVEQLAKACAERLHADRNLDVSGLIINTSGWVDGDAQRSPSTAFWFWLMTGYSRICARRCHGRWPWPSWPGRAVLCSGSRLISGARGTRRSTSTSMDHRVTCADYFPRMRIRLY